MTKPGTLASYKERLDRVVDFLHEHLEEEIGPEVLAEVANLSTYHWHRIYVAMRGESVSRTLRRLRLSRAADRLANSGMAVGEIAERAGYASADAFGRAFRDHYGRTPADYRASGSHAAFEAAVRREDARGFPVTVETLPARRCAGMRHMGSYLRIDSAMARLFSALDAQRLMGHGQAMLALFFDDPDLLPEEALRSMACSPVAEDAVIAPPLEEVVLRSGRYARLRYQGPYANMRGAYRWLLGTWLPSSGHEPDEAPVFEAYLNDPSQVAPTELLTDIHLPLRTTP